MKLLLALPVCLLTSSVVTGVIVIVAYVTMPVDDFKPPIKCIEKVQYFYFDSRLVPVIDSTSLKFKRCDTEILRQPTTHCEGIK